MGTKSSPSASDRLPNVKRSPPVKASRPTVASSRPMQAAMTALSRGLIGGFHVEWPGYSICLEKLGRAVIDPRPETIEVARDAFRDLAEHVGALVMSDELAA